MHNLQQVLGEIQIAPQLSNFAVRVCHSALAKQLPANVTHYPMLPDILGREVKLGRIPHPALMHAILVKKDISWLGDMQTVASTCDAPIQPQVHAYTQGSPLWIQDYVSSINQATLEQGELETTVSPSDGDSTAFSALQEALSTLQQQVPNAYALIESLVHDIIVVDSPALIGATTKLFLGGILINPNQAHSVPHYIDTLVHEASHIELYIRQMLDPFVLDETRMIASPLRKSLRPAGAVLHASFVLGRVCMVLNELVHKLPQWQWRSAALELLQANASAFDQGLEMLHTLPDLTAAGLILRANMNKLNHYLQSQPLQERHAVT